MSANIIRGGIAAAILLATTSLVIAHGDVAPQPVNTDALPEVGEEWLTENPYREAKAGHDVWLKAVEIGSSGFNQNCARCHGLGAVSGGLAPDLRFLEAEEAGVEITYISFDGESVAPDQNTNRLHDALGEARLN